MQGASVQIKLTSPASVAVPTPYVLTLSGGAPFKSCSGWEWASSLTAAGQACTLASQGACTGCFLLHWDILRTACMQSSSRAVELCKIFDSTVCHLQITGAVRSDYNSLAPDNGSTASLGATVTYEDSAALTPNSVTVNGQECRLQVAA